MKIKKSTYQSIFINKLNKRSAMMDDKSYFFHMKSKNTRKQINQMENEKGRVDEVEHQI